MFVPQNSTNNENNQKGSLPSLIPNLQLNKNHQIPKNPMQIKPNQIKITSYTNENLNIDNNKTRILRTQTIVNQQKRNRCINKYICKYYRCIYANTDIL